MIRRTPQRLLDIQKACRNIEAYLVEDTEASEGVTFDAIRMNLLIIGEAVKNVPSDIRMWESDIPWGEIAAMRDRVAHRYFDTAHAVVLGVARNRVPELLEAVERMLDDPRL